MKGKNEKKNRHFLKNYLYACGCGPQHGTPLKEETTSVCWESRIWAASGRKEVGYVFRWRDDRSVQRHESMMMEKQNREKIKFDWNNRSEQCGQENNKEVLRVFSVWGCGKGDSRLLKVRKTQALCTEDKMNMCNTVLSKVSYMKLEIWVLHCWVNAYLRLDGTP